MIAGGHIVVRGVNVPIRSVALAWVCAIGAIGVLSALVVLTIDGTSFFVSDDGAPVSFKIVGIALAVFAAGFAGLAGLGILGHGERQTKLGVGIVAVTALTAALSILSIVVEQALPAERVLSLLWVLSLFGGLLGVALRLVDASELQRRAALVGAGAAAAGGTVGSLVTLADSASASAGKVVGACLLLAIAGVLTALMARYADADALPVDATALQ